METTFQYRFIGFDPNGVRRVFGSDANVDVAETQCKGAAMEYLKRRPDAGPLDKWTFERG